MEEVVIHASHKGEDEVTRRNLLKVLDITPAVSLVADVPPIIQNNIKWVPILIRNKILDKSDASIEDVTYKWIQNNPGVSAVMLEVSNEIWRRVDAPIVRFVL